MKANDQNDRVFSIYILSGMAGFSEIADANIMISVMVEDGEEETVRRQIQDKGGEI